MVPVVPRKQLHKGLLLARFRIITWTVTTSRSKQGTWLLFRFLSQGKAALALFAAPHSLPIALM